MKKISRKDFIKLSSIVAGGTILIPRWLYPFFSNSSNSRLLRDSFNDKIVALGKDGSVGCASIKERRGNNPKLAYWSNNGFKVYEGTYLIEE